MRKSIIFCLTIAFFLGLNLTAQAQAQAQAQEKRNGKLINFVKKEIEKLGEDNENEDGSTIENAIVIMEKIPNPFKKKERSSQRETKEESIDNAASSTRTKNTTVTDSKNTDFEKQTLANGAACLLKSPFQEYDVKLLSCEGVISAQRVEITFVVRHDLTHQLLYYYSRNGFAAYTEDGIELKDMYVQIGNSGTNSAVKTNTPLQCKVILNNVHPKYEGLNMIAVGMKTQNEFGNSNKQYGALEIREIPINWN